MIIFCCRALYFTAYSQAKQFYNGIFSYESPAVHLVSAISAGICVHVCVCVCVCVCARKCGSAVVPVMQHCTKIGKKYVLLYALFNANIEYDAMTDSAICATLCRTADLNLVGLS